MNQTFNSSFIPKLSQQIGGGSGPSDKFTRRRSLYGPGFFITVVIFCLSLVAAFGVFASIKVLDLTVQENLVQAEAKLGTIDESRIAGWKRKVLRLNEARILVEEHTALTGLLHELERITLRDTQYTTLSYGAVQRSVRRGQPSGDGNKALSVEGATVNLEHVAVQADQYRDHVDRNSEYNYFIDPHVSFIEREEGETLYGLEMTVDPRLTSFSRVLEDDIYPDSALSTVVPEPAVIPQDEA